MPGLDSAMFTPLGSQANDTFPSATLAATEPTVEEKQRALSTPDVKLEALEAKVESDEEL